MVRESDLTLHNHRRRGHTYTNTPKPNGGQAFNLKLFIFNRHNLCPQQRRLQGETELRGRASVSQYDGRS